MAYIWMQLLFRHHLLLLEWQGMSCFRLFSSICKVWLNEPSSSCTVTLIGPCWKNKCAYKSSQSADYLGFVTFYWIGQLRDDKNLYGVREWKNRSQEKTTSSTDLNSGRPKRQCTICQYAHSPHISECQMMCSPDGSLVPIHFFFCWRQSCRKIWPPNSGLWGWWVKDNVQNNFQAHKVTHKQNCFNDFMLKHFNQCKYSNAKPSQLYTMRCVCTVSHPKGVIFCNKTIGQQKVCETSIWRIHPLLDERSDVLPRHVGDRFEEPRGGHQHLAPHVRLIFLGWCRAGQTQELVKHLMRL